MVDIEGGGEVYYIGSVPLTEVELAGLSEFERDPSFTDRQATRAFSVVASVPSCKPDTLRLRFCRNTNDGAIVGNSFIEGDNIESEQILASVQQALRSREPQRSWQFPQGIESSLGSVGRKCSPQLLNCLSEEGYIKFLEEAGLLEPVIATEPEEAAAVGREVIYASQLEPRPIMPSFEPFLHSR